MCWANATIVDLDRTPLVGPAVSTSASYQVIDLHRGCMKVQHLKTWGRMRCDGLYNTQPIISLSAP